MTTRRKIALVALAVFFAYRLRIIKKLRELRRAFVLLQRLPHPVTKGRSKNFIINDSINALEGNDSLSLVERVQRKSLAWMKEKIEAVPGAKEVGVLNVPLLTPEVDRMIPFNTICFLTIFGNEKVKEILSSKSMSKLSKGEAYEISHSLIGDSVLSTSGEVWHSQRKVIEKGFTDEMMNKAVPRVARTVHEMLEKWERTSLGEPVKIHEEMLKLTMDVLGRSVLNYDFNSVTATTTDDAPLYNAFNTLLNTLNTRVMIILLHWLRWLPTPANLRYNSAMSKLNGAVDRIIQSRTKERKAGKKACNDLLDILLEASENADMSDKQLHDNIKTILFAGHDTTGAALSWLVYLLSENRDIEAKLLAEIREHFPKARPGELIVPTMEKLEKMDYLNACIQEVLRIYPSAGFTRTILEEFTFKDGTKVPAGIEVFFFPYLTHRLEENYEDALTFKPERWLEQTSKSKLSLQTRIGIESSKADNIKYFPFSTGPRNCVGRKLALLEMRVVIINLLNRFSFTMAEDPDFQEDPVVYMTLNPLSIKAIPTLRQSA